MVVYIHSSYFKQDTFPVLMEEKLELWFGFGVGEKTPEQFP